MKNFGNYVVFWTFSVANKSGHFLCSFGELLCNFLYDPEVFFSFSGKSRTEVIQGKKIIGIKYKRSQAKQKNKGEQAML